MTKVLLVVVAASLVVATASASYARGGGASGFAPGTSFHSTDQLPEVRVPLVLHLAICSGRMAACAAIQARRALPPDIDSHTMCTT
jgi:hypothetical protein